ncbi:outer membrane lipoprotein-sorting protein [uncultured Paraglaciecola sp.]|uniref:outer membrane lipoprotein-sorting protein n=1 Tax=uncultured Paraglaciecola sp. TaxID=1765024 RepID=UPI0025D856DD|nr:outer membrane lipoprotein-sorting protein [uncultured Paraglaciecola sp.]
MKTIENPSRVQQLARLVVHYPKINVLISLVVMIALLSALPLLYKDTRADAFLAADNPALVYQNVVKEQFGLSDPIVIAIINDSEKGVFNPTSLQLIDWLTEEISALDNINAQRVTSLATENNITGSDEGMQVDPFFDEYPDTQHIADKIWRQVSDFPLYMGSLIAEDKKATVIVAELNDKGLAEITYQQVLQLVENAPIGQNDTLYIAGEGAISGYLGSYIDADAQRLNPLAGLIITIIVLFAFRRFSPALLANIIIAASVLMTLAVMALFDVPFFVITNAMPVILIGISVADSMHIFSDYFERQANNPEQDKKEIIVETLVTMWRPITLTTLTTIAGFIGLYFSAYMPPFKFFGLFTAIGVAIAWIYSLIFLPAAMSIIQPNASKRMVKLAQSDELDTFAKIMVFLGNITMNNARKVIVFFVLIILSGFYSATHLSVNENRIETFHPSEPLFKADQAINQHLNGTNNLNIIIEANESEALFTTENLTQIEALQTYALTLENVKGATSIVDYLKQIHRSLNGGDKQFYWLPKNKELIAQYFLIYSASSDPTDFEEEIDYDYRIANIRLSLNKGSYQDNKDTVEKLNSYIEDNFNSANLTATLSGRVNVNYHWIEGVGESHFLGLGISLFLVLAVSALLFGSLTAGLFAILPVLSSILLVYAAMVLLKINLGVGTSMFASVAIGLGVDFSIHTIDRLRTSFKDNFGNWDQALADLYPLTGRALFFNYLAIALGFGVLISSKVVPLTNFGTIVFISVTTSFFASMSFLPALIKLTKPKFITDDYLNTQGAPRYSFARKAARLASAFIVVGVLSVVAFGKAALASPDVLTVVDNINKVDDGDFVTRKLTMTLVDKRGKTRVRETQAYRKYYDGEKRTVLFYKKPTNVKGTAFLTFDYEPVEKEDNQWLYLPALRKVRRISASDRGDYFLGTDFTYEDIKQEGKLALQDYDYSIIRFEPLTLENGDHYDAILMKGVPKTKAIAKELGYARNEFWVDSKTWVIIKVNYWDLKDKPLKTLIVTDIRKVDDILTRHNLAATNHKTGHKTTFVFSDVDYKTQVKDKLFTQRAMKLGK